MDEKKKKFALLTVALGFWLIAIRLTFAFSSHKMCCSDAISGILLVAFGVLSLAPKRIWSGWAVAAVGVWLQLAPLAFWAPSALNYLNDTLIGAIAIVFSFHLTASQYIRSEKGAEKPQGWSYNPSAWPPRIITICLAMLCWSFSRYMAAFQLGYIDHVWDPIFKDGTLRVITSQISRDFPVSDAGLGAFCYTLEFLFGWQGSDRRWYAMPWLVLMFGMLVVPVGIVSIVLIILQPVVVGAWCSWCLATAASMLLMILMSGSEILATIGFLRQSVQEGDSFWKVLWKGKKADKDLVPIKPRARPQDKMAWGFTSPWNLVVLALLGAYLMLSPYLFSSTGHLATGDYIIGPFMITFSIISMVEVFRAARYINIVFGLWLIAIPFIWPASSLIVNGNDMAVGLIAIALAFPKGKIRERYGIWERFIF